MKEKDKKLFYQDQAKKIATRFIDPLKKGAKQLKRKEINEGMRPVLVNPILSPWLHWREICILDGRQGEFQRGK